MGCKTCTKTRITNNVSSPMIRNTQPTNNNQYVGGVIKVQKITFGSKK